MKELSEERQDQTQGADTAYPQQMGVNKAVIWWKVPGGDTAGTYVNRAEAEV